MKKPLLTHPFLFALFPILSLYSHNVAELSLPQLVMPIIVTCFTVEILWSSLRALFEDECKTGMIVSLLALLFFSHGHFAHAVENLNIKPFYLLLMEGIVFLAITIIIIPIRKDLRNISSVLNIISSFLVVISLANITTHEIKSKASLNPRDIISRNFLLPPKSYVKETNHPDIYYIIFDRYPSASTLKEHFQFDNKDLINFLTQKGFYVAENSFMNYPTTFLSLASSLNMNYLTPMLDHVKGSTDRSHAYRLLQNYTAELFLKSQGYRLIHLGSWYNPTKQDTAAELNLYYHYSVLDDFSSMLIENSLFFPLMKFITKLDSDKQFASPLRQRHIENINYQFRELRNLPQTKGPKFVFAHILLPHYPYIYDPDGKVLNEEITKKTSLDKNFINQLIYTNKKIKWLVNQILSDSEHPPIIIIQGDEGPLDLIMEVVKGGDNYEWRTLSSSLLKKYMRILNAYYLPDIDKRSQLYPSITPVNSFRLIFNLYFNTNYPLLKDEIYIIESLKFIYRFYNVTNKLTAE